jgi:hypothetical protein
MKADAIRYLIMKLVEAAHREGTFTEAVALQVEREFREEYAGNKIYVASELRAAPPVDELRERYLAGEPVERITSTTGVSRATLYRLIKR